MWATWCSVLMTYRMAPRDSASRRILTALLGSCGVSTTTTPSEVTTRLGLQPRILVVVNTFSVTCSTAYLLGGDAIEQLMLRPPASPPLSARRVHHRCVPARRTPAASPARRGQFRRSGCPSRAAPASG